MNLHNFTLSTRFKRTQFIAKAQVKQTVMEVLEQQYVTINEALTMYNISASTIHRYKNAELLGFERRDAPGGGHRIFLKATDLERLFKHVKNNQPQTA